MLPADQRTLRALTTASGPLARRFLSDQHDRVPLDVLAGGTVLGRRRAGLRGRSVVLLARTQLATCFALLELDGLARRIVVCPPDFSRQHLPDVLRITEADTILATAADADIAGSGAVVIVPQAPAAFDGRDELPLPAPTEWALFTSGTTGPPKIALHTLHTLAGAIRRVSDGSGAGVWSTFYDIRRYGGLQMLLRALIGGGSMVLSGAEESPSDFLARVGAAGVTFISATPTHWRRAMLSPAADALQPANVRLSGEAADQAILDKLRARFPQARVAHAFASTEAGVAFEVDDGKAGFPAAFVGPERNGVCLRIQNETLRIRSPRTAGCYLGAGVEPLADAEGFVDTKDLVELRGDRYYFNGRKDGVINVGGLKVHPEEVEAVINRHPEVVASLVSARRSPIVGAFVVADVVAAGRPVAANDGDAADTKRLEAEILTLCRASLAAYKVPATLRFVPALDVTPSGKLRRRRG